MEIIEQIYDVIVVGSGPAGLTAALYASRADLDTIILDQGLPGGQLNNTEKIENYTGFSSIKGIDLAQNMYEGSLQFGAQHQYGPVEKIELDGDVKKVFTSNKQYNAYSVIIATGAEHKELNIPGESEFNGRGVSYCAVCDGAFYRNRHIVVVGGGDSAVEEGTYLTQFADKVTIIHRRDELRAQKILQDRARANDKVEILWNKTVEEIQGDDTVKQLQLRDCTTGEETTFEAEGVFIYIGLVPNTEEFQNLGITNAEGWIETDEYMRTSIPGIYAIGDVRHTPLRQVATAVGDGSIAGNDVYNYIQTLEKVPVVETKK